MVAGFPKVRKHAGKLETQKERSLSLEPKWLVLKMTISHCVRGKVKKIPPHLHPTNHHNHIQQRPQSNWHTTFSRGILFLRCPRRVCWSPGFPKFRDVPFENPAGPTTVCISQRYSMSNVAKLYLGMAWCDAPKQGTGDFFFCSIGAVVKWRCVCDTMSMC